MSTRSFLSVAYRKAKPARASATHSGLRRRSYLGAALLMLLISGGIKPALAQDKPAGKREIRVAAASDLQTIFPLLAQQYEAETGIKIVTSFGSSGTLSQQIINGAPIDIFFGADFTNPERIVAAKLSDLKAPVLYGKGTLVLFARKDSPLQPLHLEEVTDPRVTRIAVGDPIHAPYGFATARALDRLKLTAALKPKLVVAENIAQAAQFVESGNAELAFISLTLALSSHMRDVGTYVLVPTVYPPIRQYAITLQASPHLKEAHDFLEWVRSGKVQTELKQMGLDSYL